MVEINFKSPIIKSQLILSKDISNALDNRSEELSTASSSNTLEDQSNFTAAKSVFEASSRIAKQAHSQLRFSIEKDKYELCFNKDSLRDFKIIKNKLNNLSAVYLRQANSKMSPRDDGKKQITVGDKTAKHEVYLATKGKLNGTQRPYAKDIMRLGYDASQLQELFFGSINKSRVIDNKGSSKNFWFNLADDEIIYGSMKSGKKQGVFAIKDSKANLSLVNFVDNQQCGRALTLTKSGCLVTKSNNLKDYLVLFPNEDIFQGEIKADGSFGEGVLVTKQGLCLLGNFTGPSEISALRTQNQIEQGKFDKALHLSGPGSKVYPATQSSPYASEIQAEWDDILEPEQCSINYANGLKCEAKLVIKDDNSALSFDDAYLSGNIIFVGPAKLALNDQGDNEVFVAELNYDTKGEWLDAKGRFDYANRSYSFKINNNKIETIPSLDLQDVDFAKVHHTDLYQTIVDSIIPEFKKINNGLGRFYQNGVSLNAVNGWQDGRPVDGTLYLTSPDGLELKLEQVDGKISHQAKVTNFKMAHALFNGKADISSISGQGLSIDDLVNAGYKLKANGQGELRSANGSIEANWQGNTPVGEITFENKYGSLKLTIDNGKIKDNIAKLDKWIIGNGEKYSGEAKIVANSTNHLNFIDLLADTQIIANGQGTLSSSKYSFKGTWADNVFESGSLILSKVGVYPKYRVKGEKLTKEYNMKTYTLADRSITKIAREVGKIEAQVELELAETRRNAKKSHRPPPTIHIPRKEKKSSRKNRQNNLSGLATSLGLDSLMSDVINSFVAKLNKGQTAIDIMFSTETMVSSLLKSIYGGTQNYKLASYNKLKPRSIDSLKTPDFLAKTKKLQKALRLLQFLRSDLEVFVFGEGRNKQTLQVLTSDNTKKFLEDDKSDFVQIRHMIPEAESATDFVNNNYCSDNAWVEIQRFSADGIDDKEEFVKLFKQGGADYMKPAAMSLYNGPIINGKPDSSNSPDEKYVVLEITNNLNSSKAVYSAFKNGEVDGDLTIFCTSSAAGSSQELYAITSKAKEGVVDSNCKVYFNGERVEIEVDKGND